MCHDPVNEQIKLMSLSVLRTLLGKVRASSHPWYAIVFDEATDVANGEQFNMSVQWVNESYEISEDVIGLFCF